jgi:antitoxin ParD1/3/4
MPRGETISVTMTPDLLRAMRERVEAGEYESVDAALDDAVRALQRQRREEAAHLDSIRARIQRSLDDPRPPSSIDEVEARMEALFAQARDDRHRA